MPRATFQLDRPVSDGSHSDEDIYSDEDLSGGDDDEDTTTTRIHVDLPCETASSRQATFGSGSVYKPLKCSRCFYRSNWKTDMHHHIRLKHQLDRPSKSDYVSMDFDSALRTFPAYERTFGKVLKSNSPTSSPSGHHAFVSIDRLLLARMDYSDCSWEELKAKLLIFDDDDDCQPSSAAHVRVTATDNDDTHPSVDNGL